MSVGVHCYWIGDLQEMCLEVYTEPYGEDEADYGSSVKVGRDEKVSLTIDGEDAGEIAVNELLP